MEIKKENQMGLKRWQNNRLGMFIHWGLYALPARHEWIKRREHIADKDYKKYFEHFNPEIDTVSNGGNLLLNVGPTAKKPDTIVPVIELFLK